MKKWISCLLALAMLFASVSCATGGEVNEDFVDNDEPYELVMYTMINSSGAPKDLSLVVAELNRQLETKLPNTTIKIIPYITSEYNAKINQKLGNAEKIDLLWCDFVTYPLFLEMEALYPLDSLIDRYAPEAKADFDERLWDQVRWTDGKIYAMMNNQILPRGLGINMRDKEYWDEFLVEVEVTQDQIIAMDLNGKFDILEDYMLWLRQNKNGEGESSGGLTFGMEIPYILESLGFDTLGSPMNVPGVVRPDDNGELKVVNQYETEEFKTIITRLHQWYLDGFIPKDIGQGTYNESNLDVLPLRTYAPGDAKNITVGGRERNMYGYQFGEMHYLQSYIMGTMWAVSAYSENPARAVKFVNLMHSDPEIHNLLKLGIEGTHYNVVEVGDYEVAEQTEQAARYDLSAANWTFGNTFIGLPLSTQPADLYEQHRKINEETPLSKVIGFTFDRSSVLTDIQIVSGIIDTGLGGAGYGKMSEEDYEEFIASIKEKSDIIIAEKQRQLDEWLAQQE